VKFPPEVFDKSVRDGLIEVFLDEHGDERVRLTPKGMRAAGVSKREIARVVESERRAGRPYKAEA